MVSSLSPSFLFFNSCLFLNIFNCLKLHTKIINFYLFLGKLKIFVQTQLFIHYFYSSFHLVLNTTCSGGNFSSFLTDKNTLSDSEWFRSSLIVGLEPLLFQNQGLNPSLLMWCIFFLSHQAISLLCKVTSRLRVNQSFWHSFSVFRTKLCRGSGHHSNCAICYVCNWSYRCVSREKSERGMGHAWFSFWRRICSTELNM